MSPSSLSHFDHIIVGGGTAGCVLASRLSANPVTRVLLIEAGPDFAPGSEPPALLDPGVRSFMLHQYFWPGLASEHDGRRTRILQARVVGGGSTINGMHAQRGLPRDYDEWQQFGVDGWRWQDNLPYFKKLERDVDFEGPFHGSEGPISIRRTPESQWSPLTLALREAFESRGVPRLQDINTELGDGTSAVPLCNGTDARVSTANAYLTQAVRSRENLQIIANTRALHVSLVANKVTGVTIEGGMTLTSDHVVVCAGAIHSPALLMRSGIGPGEQLRRVGIAVVADRQGVGRNLRTHPVVTVCCHVKRAGRQRNFRKVRPPVPMVVRYSSGKAEPSDMALNLWERTPGPLANDPLGRQLPQLMIILNKSYSQGIVALDPADPHGALKIRADLLSDRRDLERMVSSFEMICGMLTEGPMAKFIDHMFVANMSLGIPPDRLTLKLLEDKPLSQFISSAGAFAFDHIPGIRARYLSKSGRTVASILAEPDSLRDFVRRATAVGGHPGGTCRLGAVTDPNAVVDGRCRVIGIEGLRVVDASIFPTLMRGGTSLPTIMAAEKAADMILEDERRDSEIDSRTINACVTKIDPAIGQAR